MPTAEELTLAIKAENVGETRDQLEGVESSMEETAKSAGDSAEELEGFSERFAGAMGAAVAALAVGAAGLLSQVPVLGEAFGGLSAIVSAVAFQMDGVLRPALSPLTDLFFKISNAIFNADGALGALIGAIGTIVALAATIIPTIAAVGSAFGVWGSVGAGVVAIVTTIGSAIAGLIGTLAGLISLPALVIAAIVALAAALIFNIGGARDKLANILSAIWGFFADLGSDLLAWGSEILSDVFDFFAGLGTDLIEWASGLAGKAYEWGVDLIGGIIDGLASLIDTVVDGFTDLATGLANWAGNLAEYDWGVGIIEAIISGLKSMAETLANTLVNVFNDVVGKINNILDKLPSEVTSRIGFEQIQELESVSLGGGSATAPSFGFGSEGTAGRGLSPVAGAFARRGSGGQGGGTTLDGRQITESTGRYRSAPARRQGL